MRKLWSSDTTKARGQLVRFSGGPWEGAQHDVKFDRGGYPVMATRVGCYRFAGVNASGEVVYAYARERRAA